MSRVTDIMLERYLAEDLEPRQRDAIAAAIAQDPALAARLEALKVASASYLEERPADVFTRRLQGRMDAQPPKRSPWWHSLQQFSTAMALVCLCGVTYWLTMGAESLGPATLDVVVEDTMVSAIKPKEVSTEPRAPAPDRDISVPDRVLARQAPAATGLKQASEPKSHTLGQPKASPKPTRQKKAKRAALPRPEPKMAARAVPAQTAESRAEATPAAPSEQGAFRSRIMMRKTASLPFEIRVKDPQGRLRPASRPLKIRKGDSLVFRSELEDGFYYSMGATQQGVSEPVLGLSPPELIHSEMPIQLPVKMDGPVTFWVFTSKHSFSTEKILFDGFSFRSQDEKIQNSAFFAIFLK